MEYLETHPQPEQVRLVCHSESTARIYRQTWNLWYAAEKADRMELE